MPDDRTIVISVDLNVYNETVITKVLYGWSNDYQISWQNKEMSAEIRFQTQDGKFSNSEIEQVKSKLSKDFIDFKTRDIVYRETKAIRELLLVKAFANNDEFDERDLFSL